MDQGHFELSSCQEETVSCESLELWECHLLFVIGNASQEWHENVQTRPESTNTSRNVSKIPNEEAVQERLPALQPNALATGLGVGKDCRVIDSEIDLVSYGVGHSHGRCIGLGDVINEAMCWVWQLQPCQKN
jgi:hypothetical protein